MSKTNLSRRKPRFVAETISARRGRCALCALVRVREVDLLVAIGARSIERKAEFGLCRIPKSLVTHRLHNAHYIARSIYMACAHVGACMQGAFQGGFWVQIASTDAASAGAGWVHQVGTQRIQRLTSRSVFTRC